MAVKPIPDGYHSLTPYLVVSDATKALAFYAQAFGAKELFRLPMPNGKIAHAEMKVGDSAFMLADEAPEMDAKSPATIGGSPVSLLLYVPNVDAMVKQAEAAGATIVRPVADQFYGDRSAVLVDPFGHKWSLATHVEDVSPEEMNKRFEKLLHGHCEGG